PADDQGPVRSIFEPDLQGNGEVERHRLGRGLDGDSQLRVRVGGRNGDGSAALRRGVHPGTPPDEEYSPGRQGTEEYEVRSEEPLPGHGTLPCQSAKMTMIEGYRKQ